MYNEFLTILLQLPQTQQRGGYSGLIVIALIVVVIGAIVIVVKNIKTKNQLNHPPVIPQQTMGYNAGQNYSTSMMVFCPKCGVRLNNNMRFCSNCGYDITSYQQKYQSATNSSTEDNEHGLVGPNLIELKRLLDVGAITQEDYDRKKNEYLEKL